MVREHCKIPKVFVVQPVTRLYRVIPSHTTSALEMKHLTAFIGAAAMAVLSLSAQAQAVKPDLAKGAAYFGQVCVACHAADGNSSIPENPRLAQQHPEYLVKQLQEFKAGKRANPVMSGFAGAMSDEDMRNVAYWLASQKAKTGFAKDKALVVLGEKIYRGGIADRRIAACAGCHAPNGAGIPAQYPRLAGQHADYTSTQLKAFRAGTRHNNLQMTHIAAHMTDVEIAAVSDYIAGLR